MLGTGESSDLGENVGVFSSVMSRLQTTIEASHKRFYSAIDGGSTGWADWVDDSSRKQLKEALSKVDGRWESGMWSWLMTAPDITTLELANDSSREVRILAVPYGSRFTRHYPPGCLVMSKLLSGECSVKSYITSKRQGQHVTRETNHLKYDTKSQPFMYFGGQQRVLSCNGKSEMCIFIEVVLKPPSRLSPLYSEHNTGVQIYPSDNSTEALEPMFCFTKQDNNSTEGLAPNSGEKTTIGDGSDFNVDTIRRNVGGLDSAVNNITRRIFATRRFPPKVIEKLGLQHVRGMLLYGPPGCGKTLLAREIARALHAREPKIVSGPEILNKWVGEAEKSIRGLFAEAEREQKEKGRESRLHVVILDEMDAVCKVRGTVSDGGVRDSVVNQLLAKLDGVDQLHNLLVIGLTNRRELIDPALLRPGRLEVQMYVGLPDAEARHEILGVHLSRLVENDIVRKEVVELYEKRAMAEATEGFSGAEIAGLVRSAMSFAIVRATGEDDVVMTVGDYERALRELRSHLAANNASENQKRWRRPRVRHWVRKKLREWIVLGGNDDDEGRRDVQSLGTGV